MWESISLVEVFSDANQDHAYAIIDDQSNRSPVSPNLIDKLNIKGDRKTYTLSLCSGTSTVSGHRIKGLCVKSYDQTVTFNLPEVIECD